MSSLYVHIPFCKSACNYCNFHFTTSLRYTQELLASIKREITIQKHFFDRMSTTTAQHELRSIYFGGGTPSILQSKDLAQVLTHIQQTFPIHQDVEITLEINPDDVSNQKIQEWRHMGFNRYSLGVQSFEEEDLRYLQRAHSAKQAMASVELLLEAQVRHFSIDLIFGIPSEDPLAHTKKNLTKALQYAVPHLSCYSLTVEPHTPLQKHIHHHRLPAPNTDIQADEWMYLVHTLSAKGYEHYEISNYALPHHRSRHNTHYWTGLPYLGIGPSAHSFDGEKRYWNKSNNTQYIHSLLTEQRLDQESEMLSLQDRYNEFVMLRLRLLEGLSYYELETRFGKNFVTYFHQQLSLLPKEYFIHTQTHIALSSEGKLFCDRITASLFAASKKPRE